MTALAQTLNAMLARLRGAFARERAFVANAGHELRTELELVGKPGRTREELVAAVRRRGQGNRPAGPPDRRSAPARRGQDERFLHRDRVAVRDVLEAAAAGFATRAEERHARLLLEVRPDDLTATWDQDLVRQVVANLVDNALRYGCCAGREHAASVIRVTATGFTDRVVLSVQDDGPGFPENFLPHAFERFSRADAARGTVDSGAGLGLSIVELITGVHDGRARVANRPDGGAEVTVEIPEPR